MELKTETGKVSKEQKAWLTRLTMAGVDTNIWRPSHWDNIVRLLVQRHPTPAPPSVSGE